MQCDGGSGISVLKAVLYSPFHLLPAVPRPLTGQFSISLGFEPTVGQTVREREREETQEGSACYASWPLCCVTAGVAPALCHC